MGSALAALAVAFAVGCGSATVKECLTPGRAFEAFVHRSSTTGYRFVGFRMVEMSEDFVERWDSSGYEIRYIIAAWPVGWDPEDEGADEADIATWIAASVDPLEDVRSVDPVALSTSGVPWVGLEVGMDLLDANALNRPIGCTLDALEG
jgi:hypothetical protein